MSHCKEKIVALVIILYAGHFYYQYFNITILPEYRTQSGEWVREFRNPLMVIFTGKQALSDNRSYARYDVMTRGISLTYSIFAIVLAVALINYFRSKSHGVLKAFFMIELWKNISILVFTFFYYAWNKAHPEEDILSYHRDFITVAHGIVLTQVLAGIFILRSFSLPPTADGSPDSPANLQGMRGFHFLVDRLLLLLLGNNFFIFLYLYRNTEGSNLWIWLVLSMEGALLVCYFVCEKLTGMTPGKILTGTKIGHVGNSEERVTTAAVLTRTLSRLIPFESFSFLSVKGGWHDRISNTAVYYAAEGHWLMRQTQIVRIMFSVLIALVAWFLFGWLTRVYLQDCQLCRPSIELPQYLGMICLPIAMLLFTGWLAAVTHHAMIISSRRYPSSSSIYAIMATWWMPLYNFFILKDTVTPMLEAWEVSGISPEAIQKLKRAAATLRICFVLFYLSIFCAFLSIKLLNGWFFSDAILPCLSLGVLSWSIGTLKFCAALPIQLTINN